MVTCQSSELGLEVTVELPADFLSLGRGYVSICSCEWFIRFKCFGVLLRYIIVVNYFIYTLFDRMVGYA